MTRGNSSCFQALLQSPQPRQPWKEGLSFAEARSNFYQIWIVQFFYICCCPLHLLPFKVLMLFVNKKLSAPLFPKWDSHINNVPKWVQLICAGKDTCQVWSQYRVICPLVPDNQKSTDNVLSWVMVQPMRIKISSFGAANHSSLDFIVSKSRWLWRDFFSLYLGSRVNLKHVQQCISSDFGFRSLDQTPRIYCLFV